MATTTKRAAARRAVPKKAAPKKAAAPPKAAAKATRTGRAPSAAPAPAKTEKAKKPKLVRDSFTIPKTEYAVLEELKLRAVKLGRPSKKSEVIRAGVQALAGMGDAAFLATLGAVPPVKTGRPAKA